jgi:plastocyanin
MKTKLSLMLLTVLLLTACGVAATPTSNNNNPVRTNPTNTPLAANTSQPQPTDTSTAALSGNVDVAMAGFAFNPAELTIKVGTTITWTNQDSATHDVKAVDDSWGSGNLGKGDTFSFTFNQAGTYAYRCSFHGNMKGTITVVP